MPATMVAAAVAMASWLARRRWITWALAVAVITTSTTVMLWPALGEDAAHWLVDLQVYQGAGDAVRRGDSLYDYRSPYPQLLPFTYPPFSGVLAMSLSLLSRYPLGLVWTAVEFAMLLWLAARLFQPVIRRAGAVWPLAFAAVVAVLEWLAPIRQTFYFGQINLFLVGLVVADLTVVRARWPRGLLTGIAAAVKLTPALFLLHLWTAGRRRAAWIGAATFVGAQAIALAVIPSDSVRYWTSTVFEGERLGLNAGDGNQSLRGMLLRFALPEKIGLLLWVALALPVAIIGLRRARAAFRDGDMFFSIGLTGLTAALVSPVSWVHHFLWIAVVIAAVLGDGRDLRRVRWAVGLALAFSYEWPRFGKHLIGGDGSYVVGRLFQEGDLLLTLVVVCALPWRHILASVDAPVARPFRRASVVAGGEAASNGRP